MSVFFGDSRPVEATTGWYVALLSFWCWLGDWFGGFLSRLEAYHGLEWIVAVVGVPYGLAHVIVAHSDSYRLRSSAAMFVLFLMALLTSAVWISQGWHIPGVPACGLTVAVQGWIYLRVKALHNVDLHPRN